MRRFTLLLLTVLVLAPVLWAGQVALAEDGAMQKPPPPPTPMPAKPTVPPTPWPSPAVPSEKPEPKAALAMTATPALLPATGGRMNHEIIALLVFFGVAVVLVLLGIVARKGTISS